MEKELPYFVPQIAVLPRNWVAASFASKSTTIT